MHHFMLNAPQCLAETQNEELLLMLTHDEMTSEISGFSQAASSVSDAHYTVASRS